MRIIDAGMHLYHATQFEHVSSIADDGIQDVLSGWDEGELGRGFYTATTLAGSAAYLSESGAVLEFLTNRKMTGFAVRPAASFDWDGAGRGEEIKKLSNEYDYLVSSTDGSIVDYSVSQVKINFKSTQILELVAVHLMEDGDWKRYLIQEYRNLFLDS